MPQDWAAAWQPRGRPQNRIRAQLALVRRPVEPDHQGVDAHLVQRVETGHFTAIVLFTCSTALSTPLPR